MYLLVASVHLSALWSTKSRQWLDGRKNWHHQLKTMVQTKSPRLWVHVSSLGEFEQAKPVMEYIKDKRPDINIVLSFFSPSGFLQKKDYALAEVIYLPADLPGNATRLLEIIKPDMAVFVKYDLWPGYLKALADARIKSILISADWTPNDGLSSWSLPLAANLLKNFDQIFFQRPDNVEYFRKKGFQNIQCAGDTRVDRSLSLPGEVVNRLSTYEILKDSTFDLVAGSTWPEDEEILIPAIHALNLKCIIAPHDVSSANIKKLTEKISAPFQLLSDLTSSVIKEKVIVVDSIGLLSTLYSKGKVAYVGGGFGKGIHNTLEPAAHGKPILFGPKFNKFPEATGMIKLESARSVKTKNELVDALKLWLLPGIAEQAGMKNYNYLVEHQGATRIVSDYILESIPSKLN